MVLERINVPRIGVVALPLVVAVGVVVCRHDERNELDRWTR